MKDDGYFSVKQNMRVPIELAPFPIPVSNAFQSQMLSVVVFYQLIYHIVLAWNLEIQP